MGARVAKGEDGYYGRVLCAVRRLTYCFEHHDYSRVGGHLRAQEHGVVCCDGFIAVLT